MRAPRPTSTLLCAATLLVAGCKDEAIRSYQGPKDEPPSLAAEPAPPVTHEAAAAGPATEIRWQLPPNWRQQPAAGMRYATILVGPENDPIELSVIPLGPDAATVLPNVNRWRVQLGLQPIDAGQLPQCTQPIEISGATATLVDLVAPVSAEEQEVPKRMLAAIVAGPHRVWFFKATGPSDLLGPERPAFETFLRSVRFTPTHP